MSMQPTDLTPTTDELAALATKATTPITLEDALTKREAALQAYAAAHGQVLTAQQAHDEAMAALAEAHQALSDAIAPDVKDAAQSGLTAAMDQAEQAARERNRTLAERQSHVTFLQAHQATVEEAAMHEYNELVRDKRSESELELPWCPAHQKAEADGPHPFITAQQFLARVALPSDVSP